MYGNIISHKLVYFYSYRINDDTLFGTEKWTEKFTSTLRHYNPAYLGVVGPKHKGGNTGILTYDFTHRTHIDINGFYYPRHFIDWYADGWITFSYEKLHRMTKSNRIRLVHTMRRGSRYNPHRKTKEKLFLLVNKSATIIDEWKTYLQREKSRNKANLTLCTCSEECERNVISLALISNDSLYTTGALRNLMLAKKLFPDWSVRLYAGNNIPSDIEEFLTFYGAEIVYVNRTMLNISSTLWPYLIADDPLVTRFIVRNVTHRLSPRQSRLINDWQMSDYACHTIRDLPDHSNLALVPDLFGAVRVQFLHHIGTSILSLFNNAIRSKNIVTVKDLLNKVIWFKISNHTMSHDSVSAKRWPSSVSISKLPYDVMKIGKVTNQYEEEMEIPTTI